LGSGVTPVEEVLISSQTLPLVEEEAHISKHVKALERAKI
jgi:hypothetical protein